MQVDPVLVAHVRSLMLDITDRRHQIPAAVPAQHAAEAERLGSAIDDWLLALGKVLDFVERGGL